MTGPWPDWALLATVAAGLAAAYIALLLAAAVRRALAARRADHAAFEAAVTRAKAAPKTPAPGDAAKLPPSRPVHPPPAPGSPHRIGFTVTTWQCGQMRAWDGHGHVIAARECACRRREDWGQWEQELACPDCRAAAGRSCFAGCPRLVGDPDG